MIFQHGSFTIVHHFVKNVMLFLYMNHGNASIKNAPLRLGQFFCIGSNQKLSKSSDNDTQNHPEWIWNW